MKPKTKIDLDNLQPEQRRRVERALYPRSIPFSLRFSEDEITSWRATAKLEEKTMTDWVADLLNAGVETARKKR